MDGRAEERVARTLYGIRAFLPRLVDFLFFPFDGDNQRRSGR
jgi:hypothetical protein